MRLDKGNILKSTPGLYLIPIKSYEQKRTLTSWRHYLTSFVYCFLFVYLFFTSDRPSPIYSSSQVGTHTQEDTKAKMRQAHRRAALKNSNASNSNDRSLPMAFSMLVKIWASTNIKASVKTTKFQSAYPCLICPSPLKSASEITQSFAFDFVINFQVLFDVERFTAYMSIVQCPNLLIFTKVMSLSNC